MNKTKGWDLAGAMVSGICLLHCLAIPAILILFPTLGASLIPQEDMTHSVLLGFVLGTAGIAFISGYRVHGQWRPVAWMAVGVLLIIFATFFVHRHLGHFWEPFVAVIGSLFLIRAHYLNHHCKKCSREHKKHDDEEMITGKHHHHSHSGPDYDGHKH